MESQTEVSTESSAEAATRSPQAWLGGAWDEVLLESPKLVGVLKSRFFRMLVSHSEFLLTYLIQATCILQCKGGLVLGS